jgi:hypothetical protein
MSIVENMLPSTWYMCNESFKFWCIAPEDGFNRTIECFRYEFQEEDDCVECYLCVLPFAFAVDVACCPCNWYGFSYCCYLKKNNKIKPVFFEQKIKANNEIGKKNIQFYQNQEKSTQNERILTFQNREKSTQNTDNLDIMNDTDSNRTYILSSPTPSSASSVSSVSSISSASSVSSASSNRSCASCTSNSNNTVVLPSPTPSNTLACSNSDSNDSDNDCVFVKNKCTKTLELVKENDI